MELTENSGWLGLSLTYHFLAEACLGQDKNEDALEAAYQALMHARGTGAQQALGAAWRSLGKVASKKNEELVIDEKDYQAEDCLKRSDRIFTELGADGERAHTQKAWAEHEMKSGDKKLGKKMWAEAREIFIRLEMPAEVERMDKEQLKVRHEKRDLK